MVAGGAADRAVEGEVVGWVAADGDGLRRCSKMGIH
jgi:hypothetical protein